MGSVQHKQTAHTIKARHEEGPCKSDLIYARREMGRADGHIENGHEERDKNMCASMHKQKREEKGKAEEGAGGGEGGGL